MLARKRTPSSMILAYGFMLGAVALLLMSFGKKETTGIPGVTRTVIMTGAIPDAAPVDLAKVTRVVQYGNRMHPVLKEMRLHTGVDFELRAGSDVVATADGVVIVQRFGESAGNVVRIKHTDTYHTRYYHLERALVKVGDNVKKGQVIGLVGNTGLSSIPHLHYEVLKNNVAVDPKDYLPSLPPF